MEKIGRRKFIAAAAAAALLRPLSAPAVARKNMAGPREVRRALGNSASGLPLVNASAPMAEGAAGGAAALSAMDSSGISAAVMSAPDARSRAAFSDSRLAEALNSAHSAACSASPERLKFAALLPLCGGWEAEFSRASGLPGFAGVVLPAAPLESLLPPMERAASEGVPVFFTPSDPSRGAAFCDAETAAFASEACGGGFPDGLACVLPDMGGSILFSLARRGGAPFPGFYFSAGQSPFPAGLFGEVGGRVPRSAILFGSGAETPVAAAVKNLEAMGLSEGAFKAACHVNACRMFGFGL